MPSQRTLLLAHRYQHQVEELLDLYYEHGALHNFAKELSDPTDFRLSKIDPKTHPRQKSIGS